MPRFAARATLALPRAALLLLRAAASLPRWLWGPLDLPLQLRGPIKLLCSRDMHALADSILIQLFLLASNTEYGR